MPKNPDWRSAMPGFITWASAGHIPLPAEAVAKE